MSPTARRIARRVLRENAALLETINPMSLSQEQREKGQHGLPNLRVQEYRKLVVREKVYLSSVEAEQFLMEGRLMAGESCRMEQVDVEIES